jgi:DDE superfamily endonuclease
MSKVLLHQYTECAYLAFSANFGAPSKIFGLPHHKKRVQKTVNTTTMSSRNWSSSEDRRKLQRIESLYHDIASLANDWNMSRQSSDSSSESDSSVSDSSSSSDDDGNTQLENPYLGPMRTVHELLQQQQSRVHGVYEDEVIDFGQMKTIEDFSESDCINYFRFLKSDLIDVSQQLWPRLSGFLNTNNPERIAVGGRYIAHYETCLCVYLYKMSRPSRLIGDAEKFFGIRKSKLSRMIRFFGDALYQLAVQYFNNPAIWHRFMGSFGSLIEAKCDGMFPNIWGFIDCTIRKTCRPTRLQELLYTRYKRCHGIKFQSVITPNGYIACMAGPYIARRHDARILRESGLLDILTELMPLDESNGPVYALYGDLAYPQSIHLFGGFVNPPPNSPQAQFNKAMSAVRIVVEWGFSNVTRRWQHLDYQREMKIFKQPIAQQYINCCFLTNILNCFYGGATNKYFNTNTMSLVDYLTLID